MKSQDLQITREPPRRQWQLSTERGWFFLNLGLIFLLSLCLVIASKAILLKLFSNWSSADNNYCYFVVPLFAYLCWERRSDFQFTLFSWSPWGLVPVLISVGFIFIGELGSAVTLLYIGTWACIIGMLMTLYGNRVRHLTFPIIILFFITPLPDLVNQMLAFRFKMVSSSLAAIMLRLSGVNVFLKRNTIDLEITHLLVNEACSGIRYLMPLLILTLLIGHYFSRDLWRRGVLVLLLIPLAIVLNSVRIWITGILCITDNLHLAQSFFHDFSATIIFIIAGGIIFLASMLLNKIGSSKGKKSKCNCTEGPSGYNRAIILTAVVCIIFVSTGYTLHKLPDWYQLPTKISFESFPMEIGRWKGNLIYLPKKVLRSIRADDGIQAVYHRMRPENAVHLFMVFYEYQTIYRTAHTPQSCDFYGGWNMIGSSKSLLKVGPRKKITVMIQSLEKEDTKLLAGYFFYQRGRVITSPWMNKFYLFWDAITKGRTDGALVRAQVILAPGQSYEDAYHALEEFFIDLWKVLQVYVPV
ncbi:MAG: EpsI family protein [Deltaproteobacteria bacterium]|nr:EpsI family protein [Deltaproteobacteria bacterium]